MIVRGRVQQVVTGGGWVGDLEAVTDAGWVGEAVIGGG